MPPASGIHEHVNTLALQKKKKKKEIQLSKDSFERIAAQPNLNLRW